MIRLLHCRSSSSLRPKQPTNPSRPELSLAPTKLATFGERVDTFGVFITERIQKPEINAQLETEDDRRYRVAGFLTMVAIVYMLTLHTPSLLDAFSSERSRTGVLIHPTQVNSYRAILSKGIGGFCRKKSRQVCFSSIAFELG